MEFHTIKSGVLRPFGGLPIVFDYPADFPDFECAVLRRMCPSLRSGIVTVADGAATTESVRVVASPSE
jgi:hypothetical protein